MYTQLSLLLPHETMVRSHMPSARAGRNPSRAAVVAIGVGSPVARLGAHGRRGGKRGPQSAQSAAASHRWNTVHVLDSTYWTVRSAYIHTYTYIHETRGKAVLYGT